MSPVFLRNFVLLIGNTVGWRIRDFLPTPFYELFCILVFFQKDQVTWTEKLGRGVLNHTLFCEVLSLATCSELIDDCWVGFSFSRENPKIKFTRRRWGKQSSAFGQSAPVISLRAQAPASSLPLLWMPQPSRGHLPRRPGALQVNLYAEADWLIWAGCSRQ